MAGKYPLGISPSYGPLNFLYPLTWKTKINMKHKKTHDNGLGALRLPVRFELTDATAVTVSVAGTFNDWHPTTKSMHPSGNGHWLKETSLAPGIYEYCLVVDGQWMPDPQARESVPNPFGGRNSVLRVPSSPQADHLADAANLPLRNAYKQKRKL